MSIKERIKAVIGKRRESAKRKAQTDSELGAEEVVEKEVFPDKPVKRCGKAPSDAKRACAKHTAPSDCACKKPASKRTRPTNTEYKMIDPSDGTCDTSKS